VDDADAAAQASERSRSELPRVGAGDLELSARWPQRRAEDADQRRLAGAGRADHRGALAGAEPERNAAQGALAVRVDELAIGQPEVVLRRRHHFTRPAERAAASMPS
jgi:hypothetical protein